MIVQCPQCKARYRVDEARLGGRTRAQVKCTKCQNIFPISLEPDARATAGESAAARSAPEATLVSKRAPSPALLPNKNISLTVTAGPEKGKRFPITKPRVILGRGEVDIVLDDPEISRQHCAVEMRGVTGLLIDLGSTNGTFINEQKIETGELEHLSEFRIGSSTLMLMVTDKH
jgi:predicted Zn finger-like uncharacterized protein